MQWAYQFFVSISCCERSKLYSWLLVELPLTARPYTEGTAACLPSSLTKNHSFPLGSSPYPPVSVSGTVSIYIILEVFLGSALDTLDRVNSLSSLCAWSPDLTESAGFAKRTSLRQGCENQLSTVSTALRPSVDIYGRDGILTVCPSAAAFAIALGPPNPWLIASATETLDFRGSNFSLGLWLLMPTFSLPCAPRGLTTRASVHRECSPTTQRHIGTGSISSVSRLAPVHFRRA